MDRERILRKVSELEGFLKELHVIAPQSFEEFRQIEKKRACERLLQILYDLVKTRLGDFVAFKQEILTAVP